TRLLVLEEYPWSFARVAVQLSQLVATPVEVWKYFYQLPADIVSILRVSDGTDNFEWQLGRSIPYERQYDDRVATDAEEIYLYYIRDVDDMNLWVPSARSALAWRLAYEVALRLTEHSSKADRAERKYFESLEAAKSKDAPRSRPRRIPDTPWNTSRRASVSS
ncbi:MAG: hypothetical protein ACR2RE_00290, partial [Geminicoccaceae bacterium]